LKKAQYITHLKKLLLLALILRGVWSGNCKAQETDYKAYTLFIYNFMKYIEWPEAQSKGDFVIAVLGDSPVNKELQTLAAGKKLKGRNIVLKKMQHIRRNRGLSFVIHFIFKKCHAKNTQGPDKRQTHINCWRTRGPCQKKAPA